MSSDVSALRGVLRQKYGRNVSTLSELFRILESKKGTAWIQEYNRLVTWCDAQQEDLTWRTVLGHAAFLGLPFALSALLEAGMKAEMRDDLGRTPLHRIFLRQKTNKGHQEAVKTLQSYGASINLKDNYGRTPASLARKNGHLDLLGASTRAHERPSETKTKPKKYSEQENSLKFVTFDYDLFKGLLRSCDRGGEVHQTCHEIRNRGDGGARIPRWLIDTKAFCLVRAQPGMQYAALSYVWGSVQVFRTLRANLDAVQEHDAFRPTNRGLKLPKTIHDAICLCQGLGIGYLWVDAICIVQDDIDSKKSEIHGMGSIYHHAYLTIIAAGGADANAGLPLKFWRNIASEPNNYGLTATLGTLAEASVWARRGWTFQEVVLSQRWIMFLPRKFIWTCPGGSWGDWCPLEKGAPSVSEAGGITDFSLSTRPLSWWAESKFKNSSTQYADYINQYNERDLTHPSDGLAAFSGIIEYLEPALGTFIFGVPEHWFERGLHWQPNDAVRRRAANNLPTWSWVGWHGGIDRWESAQGIVDPVQWWTHQDMRLRPIRSELNIDLDIAEETIKAENASKAQTKLHNLEYDTLLHGHTQKAQILAVYWPKDTEEYQYGLGTNSAVLVVLDDQNRASGVIRLHGKSPSLLPNHPTYVTLIYLCRWQGTPNLHDLFRFESELERWGFNKLHTRVRENSSVTHWFDDDLREENHYLDPSNYWFCSVMLVQERDGICYREGLGWVECDTWERVATEEFDIVLG